MKKGLILGLIVIVGIAFLVIPLLRDTGPEADSSSPVEFMFQGQLAVVGNQDVTIKIKVNSTDVSRLQLIFDDSIIQQWEGPKGELSFSYIFGSHGVGAKGISLKATLENGRTRSVGRIVRVLSDIVPEKYIVKIMETLPHSDTSYTQGIEFYNGNLFEGTGDEGNKGKTVLGIRDLETGAFVKKTGIGRPYFGEGITILNNSLYQLTWRNGKCFVYDPESLNIKSEFTYNGEGWGLCNDGEFIIMSDGSERITFRDPNTFQIQRTIEVYNNTTAIHSLNELEYIDGKIYANVYLTDGIVVIDPKTGKVLKEIDASALSNKVVTRVKAGEVLNGIAYNSESGKIYMTGKNWPFLFEVSIVKR